MIVSVTPNNVRNLSWFCSALGVRLRGSMDFLHHRNPNSRKLVDQFPKGIPGQAMTIDTEKGTVLIHDLIHETNDVLERLKRRSFAIARDRTIEKVDVPTVLYWMARAEESGLLQVITGKLPKSSEIKGKIRKSFLSSETLTEEDKLQRLDRALRMAQLSQEQSKVFDKLCAQMGINPEEILSEQ